MTDTLFVAWRSGSSDCGRWGPIGRLDRIPDGYRFTYTRGAQTLPGFQGIAGMGDFGETYNSDSLPPFFVNRILDKRRPEFRKYLEWGGFDPGQPPEPIPLLAVTGGERFTDAFEVFPKPSPGPDGFFRCRFFLRGLRHLSPPIRDQLLRLEPRTPLALVQENLNPADPFAIRVTLNSPGSSVSLGHVPRYLALEFRSLLNACGGTIPTVSLVRVNSDAPWQFAVLCEFQTCWPNRHEPFENNPEFASLARPVSAPHPQLPEEVGAA